MAHAIPKDRSQFRVAIVCVLDEEYDAIAGTLDEDFWRLHKKDYGKVSRDQNTYKTGRVGIRDVVIVKLPWTGIGSAASAASSILPSYPNIMVAFVVGVCAGAPKNKEGDDIILGDVLISTQVIQHDHGRMTENRIERYQDVEKTLGRASREISGFVGTYRTGYEKEEMEKLVSESVKSLLGKGFLQKYVYPGREKDKLFPSRYLHQHPQAAECEQCRIDAAKCQRAQKARETDCATLCCDPAKLIRRERLKPIDTQPGHRPPLPPPPPPSLHIHFGRFASGDQVIRSSSDRERLIKEDGVIGFEMEGAGVWDNIPTVVIKGVCDYADSHKNKGFQRYAAVTAAACAKELLQLLHFDDSSPLSFNSEGSQKNDNQYLVDPRLTYSRGDKARVESHTLNYSSDYRYEILERERSREQQNLRDECLQSLWVDSMKERENQIEAETFDWIFTIPETRFTTWLQSRSGMFWISGKPGSGKSTLMKYALRDSRTKGMLSSLPNAQPLSLSGFFFHDRGKHIQKSFDGLLRSILHQILSDIPDIFPAIIKERESILGPKGNWTWTHSTLKKTLESVIRYGNGKGSACLFIDALDEFDGTHAAQVEFVTFLRQLASSSSNSGLKIKICASSRDLPHIRTQLNSVHGFAIHQWTSQDIIGYTHRRLGETKRTDLRRLFQVIIQRARGVFLWVKLVLNQLSQGLFEGDSENTLLSTLSCLPNDLPEFYARMLARVSLNRRAIQQRMLQIMMSTAAAGKTITLEYFRIALDLPEDDASLLEFEYDYHHTTLEQVRQRIHGCGGGILEVAKNATFAGLSEVQYIHQTAREFFNNPGDSDIFEGRSSEETVFLGHRRMMRLFVYFIKSTPMSPIFDAHWVVSHIEQFFDYARSAEELSDKASRSTVRSTVDCLKTALHAVEKHSWLSTWRQLATSGKRSIAERYPTPTWTEFTVLQGLFRCAEETIPPITNQLLLFWTIGALSFQQNNGKFREACCHFSRRLLSNGLNPNFEVEVQVSKGGRAKVSMLHCALGAFLLRKELPWYDYLEMIRILIEGGADVSQPCYINYWSISSVPEGRSIIHYLLQRGPARNTLAYTRACLSTIDLLLCHGADPNAVDYQGESILKCALRTAPYAVAELLLWREAKITSDLLGPDGLPCCNAAGIMYEKRWRKPEHYTSEASLIVHRYQSQWYTAETITVEGRGHVLDENDTYEAVSDMENSIVSSSSTSD